MARPSGYRLNRCVLSDFMELKHLSLSEIARACVDAKGEAMPLTTLSGLFHGEHRASMATVRRLVRGTKLRPGSLFHELLDTPAADGLPDDAAVGAA